MNPRRSSHESYSMSYRFGQSSTTLNYQTTFRVAPEPTDDESDEESESELTHSNQWPWPPPEQITDDDSSSPTYDDFPPELICYDWPSSEAPILRDDQLEPTRSTTTSRNQRPLEPTRSTSTSRNQRYPTRGRRGGGSSQQPTSQPMYDHYDYDDSDDGQGYQNSTPVDRIVQVSSGDNVTMSATANVVSYRQERHQSVRVGRIGGNHGNHPGAGGGGRQTSGNTVVGDLAALNLSPSTPRI